MDEQNSNNKKQSKWMISSMVVVAAIVALAIFVVVSNLGGKPAVDTSASTTPAGEASPAGAPMTSATAAAGSSADGGASFCGLTAVEMTGTLTKAPVATWQLFGITYVPAVDGHGPGKIDDDGYRHCYARTPTGALLATANYDAFDDPSTDAFTEKFIRTGIAPGPGREAAIEKLNEKLKQPATESSNPADRQIFQTIGFRILSYNGNTALVETASKSSAGYKVAWAHHLVWAEGDWKLLVADDGSTLTDPTLISTLDGYIPWSA
jgi:hypothetical protein